MIYTKVNYSLKMFFKNKLKMLRINKETVRFNIGPNPSLICIKKSKIILKKIFKIILNAIIVLLIIKVLKVLSFFEADS
jgi:hypothetical protein